MSSSNTSKSRFSQASKMRRAVALFCSDMYVLPSRCRGTAEPTPGPPAMSTVERRIRAGVIGQRAAVAVGGLEGGEHHGKRDAGPRAVVVDVLHVAAALAVVGVQEGVGAAVELQRRDAEALAEAGVEGRARLAPLAAD